MPETRRRDDTDPEEPRLSELYLQALNLRMERIEAQKEFLQIPKTTEEKEAVEQKQREILYQLELEGARLEREFLTSYRRKIIDIGGGPILGGGGVFEATCGLGCTQCITPCINCVTPCTICVGPCPNCVGCTTSVF